MSENLEKVSHPLFDARLLYQFLELKETLEHLVSKHLKDGVSTEPYESILQSVKALLWIVKDNLKGNENG